jgi:hypothetical protein
MEVNRSFIQELHFKKPNAQATAVIVGYGWYAEGKSVVDQSSMLEIDGD